MKTMAAVLWEPGGMLEIEEVDIPAPRAQEVVVEVVGCGVCGSDQHVIDGGLSMWGYPIVPGHEAAGIVTEVGADVTMVALGDHVLLNLMPGCGRCVPCCLGDSRQCRNYSPGLLSGGVAAFELRGQPLRQMSSIGGFAQHILVPERGCVPVRPEVPLEKACLIGCGVATGWSAVFYGGQVTPGSTAVVLGCGGVGLNVIQALKLALCSSIIAVDISASKLKMATQFGATHTVDASDTDAVAAIRDITGGGADYAFEVVGSSATFADAFAATRPGGRLVLVGVAKAGNEVTLPASFGRTVVNGGWRHLSAWRDFPLLVDLYMSGRLMVDELISGYRPLTEVNEAIEDMRAGTVARTVLLPRT
jgi:S-(hydroxymethyl)glutathione dehydrogenase/alcohol dehydrogenase